MTRYNTDPELISEIARDLEIPPEKIREFLRSFTKCFRKMLVLNGVVNIRELGLFQLRTKKKAKGRNPKTGQVIEIPLRMKVIFQAANSLKQSANERVRREQKDKISF